MESLTHQILSGTRTHLQDRNTTLESRIMLALNRRRDVNVFMQEVERQAMISFAVAESCMYYLPVGEGVFGPSVRLAEIARSLWRNCDLEKLSLPVGPDDNEVVGVATFYDLESNSELTTDARRSIVKSNGDRFSDHLITQNMNAAVAIAGRNAIFNAIPRSYWIHAYYSAYHMATSNTEGLAKRRDKMLEMYASIDISQQQIMTHLDKSQYQDLRDISARDITRMSILYRQITDGETQIDDVFKSAEEIEEQGSISSMFKAEAKKENPSQNPEKNESEQKKKSEPETASAPSKETEQNVEPETSTEPTQEEIEEANQFLEEITEDKDAVTSDFLELTKPEDEEPEEKQEFTKDTIPKMLFHIGIVEPEETLAIATLLNGVKISGELATQRAATVTTVFRRINQIISAIGVDEAASFLRWAVDEYKRISSQRLTDTALKAYKERETESN